jgi:hypothetical protein
VARAANRSCYRGTLTKSESVQRIPILVLDVSYILNWRPNRSALHKANDLPRLSRHRASGVSHPHSQCGPLSFRLLLEPPSPWPARRGGSTQKSARCVVYTLHVMSLTGFLMQAAEKSLSLLRSSPEQVTANLASGAFPSFVTT